MNNRIDREALSETIAPLTHLLEDEDTWEIMIDGYERVLIERGGKIEQVESPFSSAGALQTLIDDLFGLYGIKLDASNPVGYLRLDDYSQITAIVPPNAVDGPHLVLRRIAGRRLTWEQIIGFGSIPQEGYELLKRAVEAKATIIVSGGTGSGKTTIANLITELIPPEERIILMEQVYEMQVDHPRVVRLEAGGPGNLTLEEVLSVATRMRPDRLVVSEVNDPVVASVLQSFGNGYDGSLINIHATSVADALNRIEAFCLMANLGLGLTEIRRLIAGGIHLITNQEYLTEGDHKTRKLVEITELRGVENHRYILQPLMRYNRESREFEFTGVKPRWER